MRMPYEVWPRENEDGAKIIMVKIIIVMQLNNIQLLIQDVI